jgi:hypothetical protein
MSGVVVERFEWHYTPKHGSWLDMAELNSLFTSQCLDRRTLTSKSSSTVAAWEADRDAHHAKVDWHHDR